ncbi:hypothetical protein [Oryzibacter oryziterrae]|uniref:hypothetical protein n=1 Tax=Oryzibacter oryziterrae TaxID=2766474 RepID=UPI001F456BC3|nr:hypothetical protein [Oryzibacter oryziterrae]
MPRLIVDRAGRRVFGWAFSQDDRQVVPTVELRLDGVAIASQPANLSLSDANFLLTIDETHRHGFEFLVPPEVLRMHAADLTVGVSGSRSATPVPLPEDRVTGTMSALFVDHVDFRGFRGWAWDAHTPDGPANVELTAKVTASDGFTMSFRADQFRQDLTVKGIARGNCGFAMAWPVGLPLAARPHAILKCGTVRVLIGRKYARLETPVGLDLPGYVLSL